MPKKTHLSEDKIRAILAEQAGGSTVGGIVKKHGISAASFYNWKAKFGGAAAKRGRTKGAVRAARPTRTSVPATTSNSLADENQRLRVMVVDLMLERDRLRAQLAGR